MNTITAAVVIAVVAIIGYYLLAAFIVHKTGTTTGIADIGRAVADIIAATTRTPGNRNEDEK